MFERLHDERDFRRRAVFGRAATIAAGCKSEHRESDQQSAGKP
jgi:hypothetical protein